VVKLKDILESFLSNGRNVVRVVSPEDTDRVRRRLSTPIEDDDIVDMEKKSRDASKNDYRLDVDTSPQLRKFLDIDTRIDRDDYIHDKDDEDDDEKSDMGGVDMSNILL